MRTFFVIPILLTLTQIASAKPTNGVERIVDVQFSVHQIPFAQPITAERRMYKSFAEVYEAVQNLNCTDININKKMNERSFWNGLQARQGAEFNVKAKCPEGTHILSAKKGDYDQLLIFGRPDGTQVQVDLDERNF